MTANVAVEKSGLAMPTANNAFAELQRLSIVTEITGRKRGRVFCYRAFIDVLSDAA